MRNILCLLTIVFCFSACLPDKTHMLGADIRLFQDVCWDLAKAVQKEDTTAIIKIVKEDHVNVDTRETKFGQTLLCWAVETDKYRSVKKLLELGADPNAQDTYTGNSPIIAAANKYETSDYLKLLLEHGGNPNNVSKIDTHMLFFSPLAAAAANRLESVKLLVDAGADINYVNKRGDFALRHALTFNRCDIVKYLLLEKHAECKMVFVTDIEGRKHYITDELRTWTFKLNSDDYRMKMEIVDYLKAQGLDYWKTPVPGHYKGSYTEEYLRKY